MFSNLINVILLCFLTSACVAQWGNHGIELTGARGFLLPHTPRMIHLPEKAANSSIVRYFRTGDQSRAWHHLYPGFEFGVHLQTMGLGNSEMLGTGLAGAVYFSAPIAIKNRLQWHIEIGAGPGIITKPFEPNSNYKNIAIGSYVNSFIFASTKVQYKIHPQWMVLASASINHFSNASVALPNLGVNYPMIAVGVQRQWASKKEPSNPVQDTLTRRKNHWSTGGFMGVKQYPKPIKSRYPTCVIWGEKSLGISRKSSFTAGADLMYNLALLQYRQEISGEINALQNTQIGLRGGYSLHIDEMELFVQIGLYAIDTYKRDGSMYNRVGMRYYFSKHTGINLSLKTHLFNADYAEFGLALRF